MCGGLLTNALLREIGRPVGEGQVERLQNRHAMAYAKLVEQVRPLPGARELLRFLTDAGVRWAVATSGMLRSAGPSFEMLGIDPDRVPVVTRDEVRHATPNPDLFLAAAAKVGVHPSQAVVVGDSVWDLLAARRAGSQIGRAHV